MASLLYKHRYYMAYYYINIGTIWLHYYINIGTIWLHYYINIGTIWLYYYINISITIQITSIRYVFYRAICINTLVVQNKYIVL